MTTHDDYTYDVLASKRFYDPTLPKPSTQTALLKLHQTLLQEMMKITGPVFAI